MSPSEVMLTYERHAHLFGYLAEFADAVPGLLERDPRFYRDLCRAALLTLGDERFFEECLLAGAVDVVLARVAQVDVGRLLLGELRQKGLRFRLEGGRVKAGPADRVTQDLKNRIRRHRESIQQALAAEMLEE
jgi:hypothetical protein